MKKVCCGGMNDICERARRVAKKSGMNHQHGAVIIYDGEVIAEGYNRECNEFKEQFSVHAEVDALMKVRKLGKHILSQCDLIVVRIAPPSLDYAMKLSMPCSKCRPFIERMGIRRVYYSTNDEYDITIRNSDKFASTYETILKMRETYVRDNKRRLRTDIDCYHEANTRPSSTNSKSPRHGRARCVVDQNENLPQYLRRRPNTA